MRLASPPSASLPEPLSGLLIASAVGLDLLWPAFVLAGWEEVRIEPGNTAFTPLNFVHYPWSHSLLMAGVWGAGAGHCLCAVTRYFTGAWCWPWEWSAIGRLDAVVHRPDLPLTPTRHTHDRPGALEQRAGHAGLEGAMFVLAVWLYMRVSKPRDRFGLVRLLDLRRLPGAMYYLERVAARLLRTRTRWFWSPWDCGPS